MMLMLPTVPAQDEEKVKRMHRECGVADEDMPISIKFLPSKE